MRENSGSIVKCFDEMIEEFLVSDELRKVSKFKLKIKKQFQFTPNVMYMYMYMY